MRTRRTAQDEMAAVARRRLELLGVELAGIRDPGADETVAAPGAGMPDLVVSAHEGPGGDGRLVGDAGASLPESPATEALDRSWFWGDEAAEPERLGLDDRMGADVTDELRRGKHARRPVSTAGRVRGWVHDRLPPTLQGRVQLTAAHLSTLALLAAAALAVTAWWVVRADAGETVAPVATQSSASAGPSVSPDPLVTPVAEPSATAETEPAVVVVDVAGKVRRPGIATLPVGARVVDAIEAAGGVRRGVDLTTLNLARVLVDGEQILVGVPVPAGVAASAAGSDPAGNPAPLVNINAATQGELEELPGVGPVTAAAILQWREDNGPFTAVDELLEVSGIGEATLAEMAPFVTL